MASPSSLIDGRNSHDAPEIGILRATTALYDVNNCWSERNLLSLDGGGIRGYWTLLLLKHLMLAIGVAERAQADYQQARFDSFYPSDFPENVSQGPRNGRTDVAAQNFLPCHYFDIICGSSTGSLIAIMLCRFRMTVEDCLDEYRRMSQSIFGKPRWVSQRNIGIVRWPKYNAVYMKKAFEQVTWRRGERPTTGQGVDRTPAFPTVRGTCAMFATTEMRTKGKKGSSKKLYLIRSYDHDPQHDTTDDMCNDEIVNYGQAEEMQIWQVARAATAAPMYFTELQYKFKSDDDTDKFFFSDGGFGLTNNPTLLGLQEIQKLHGDDKVGLVVSVGTARADTDADKTGIFHRVTEAFSKATDPKTVAREVGRRLKTNYWRLNDNEGLKLELDDWKPNGWFTPEPKRGCKTLDKITNGFNAWMIKQENAKMIQECAEKLVQRRRLRTSDRSRWYCFAHGVEGFRCSSNHHEQCREVFSSRRRFEAHWESVHEGQTNAEKYRQPRYTEWTYHPAA